MDRYLTASRRPVRAVGSGAPAAVRATLRDIDRWPATRVVSPRAYAATVTLPHGVEPMRAGGLQHLQVEVTNLGDDWWPRGPNPEPAIQIGHRWRRRDGSEIEVATPRTAFTETVAPGATTRLTMAVQAPPESGDLELIVDVVHELVRWFGCETPAPVSVSPPYSDRFFRYHQQGASDSAEVIVPLLVDLVRPASVVDVGCGTGAWLRAFGARGVADVLGFDGPWVDGAELEIPVERFRAVDLEQPFDAGRRFDLALALEVAEHLPGHSAVPFVEMLTRLAPVIAFSAAVPGQGGDGHLNEQWPAYWSDLFGERGFDAIDLLREELWSHPRVEWWYAQNLLLFADTRALDAYPRLRDHPRRSVAPLPLVHPRQLATGEPSLAPMIRARVEHLDTTLFARIESQTTEPDRRSLLALHAAIAAKGPFSYLEIGSHLGGSLQTLIADPRCVQITSIDSRPASQPDDRGQLYHYEDNSTERMLALLRQVPGADFDKLTTLEAGTDALQPSELPTEPYFCFIDGEHTQEAALRDALFCLAALGETGVIAFHDSNVVEPAIQEFVESLGGRQHSAFQLPDSVYVVEVGSRALRYSPFVERAMQP